jgi:type I restriction enzyme S subunit
LWTNSKLIDLAEYINGYAFKPSDFSESGIPIIRIEQLKNQNAKYDFYNGKIPERNWINNEDLIFSWSASLFLKIWKNDFAYLNQHLFKVVPKDSIDKYFLKFLLEDAIEDLKKVAHGSTMQHITRKELQKFEVKIPDSKKEQSTIAKVLTTVDQAIDQTEKLIAKYEKIKTGLMQDLLTKGIDEQGNIRSEETHEFKDSPLGRIPKEWEVGMVKEFLNYISYGFTNPMPTTEEGPFMITATNIFNGEIQFDTCRFTSKNDFEKLLTPKSKPKIGDVLITKDGSLGRLAIVNQENICINQSVALMRVKDEKITNVFFKKLLESPKYQKLIYDDSGGSTIKHIYITRLDKMNISIPTELGEQERINTVLKEHDSFLLSLKTDLKNLIKVKSGLMQDLLTGKVSVKPLMTKESAIV